MQIEDWVSSASQDCFLFCFVFFNTPSVCAFMAFLAILRQVSDFFIIFFHIATSNSKYSEVVCP